MEYYDRIRECVRARTPVGVATVVAGPRSVGAKALVFLDGSHEGSLNLGDLEERILADAREALRYERNETRSYALQDASVDEPVRVFLEAHVPPPSLVIVGAGHTSIPLSAMARIAGFDVTLIDARSAFASRDRFPEVDEIIVGWPHEILTERPITASTYVAVLTHDSKFEDPLLPVLLRSPARYIGVIGSRRTQVQRRERLRSEGYTEDDIARLSGPIGLDIGAVTPEEIALSILAEMVARQHGRPGGFLSEKLAVTQR